MEGHLLIKMPDKHRSSSPDFLSFWLSSVRVKKVPENAWRLLEVSGHSPLLGQRSSQRRLPLMPELNSHPLAVPAMCCSPAFQEDKGGILSDEKCREAKGDMSWVWEHSFEKSQGNLLCCQTLTIWVMVASKERKFRWQHRDGYSMKLLTRRRSLGTLFTLAAKESASFQGSRNLVALNLWHSF